MSKVRFTNPAMSTFSGHYGTTLFKDGVSVESVSSAEMALLGAITSIESINEETGETRPVGPAQKMVEMRDARAPVERPIEPEGGLDPRAEVTPKTAHYTSKPKVKDEGEQSEDELDALAKSLENKIADEEKADREEAMKEAAKGYTQEQLEAIADKDGISGLREIANDLGVKSNSISGLITEIKRAQNGR